MRGDADPKRWSAAESEAPEALRELLARGRAELGSASEVAALRERVMQAIAAPEPPASPRTVPPRAATKSWLSWIAGGAATAGVIWLAASGGDAPSVAPPQAPAAPSIEQPPAPAAPAVAPPPAPAGEERAPEDAAASAEARRAPEATSPRRKAAAPRAAPSGADEVTLLQRAQAALERRPAAALKLTDEHARRFPSGALAEEREAIAVEALGRLGRGAAAKRRAARFEQRYPNSVHLDRVKSAPR